MADIKVVIQLQDTKEDVIEKLGSSSNISNASILKSGNEFDSLSSKNNGINMKSWAKKIYKNGEMVGSLSLADGYVGGADTKLVEQYGYNGYVFGAVPESKQLTVTLEVIGSNIDSIIIYGDKNANQFPTKAYLDGDDSNVIYSDDYEWAIMFEKESSSHTITFLEWNRSNYNACITYIGVMRNELVLDKQWIKSVESFSQSNSQPKSIYYGVTPSSGSVELIDINGEIKDYINDGVLPNSNVPINVYVNENIVQNHISQDSEYSNNSLTLSLTNNLAEWDNIVYDGYPLNIGSVSLFDIASNIFRKVGINLNIDMFENQFVYNRFLNISIKYAYILKSSIRETLNKICKIAQCVISKNDNGDIKIFDARPVCENVNQILSIPLKIQYSLPQINYIKKNKYDKVTINYNETSYEYSELKQIPFAVYETPAFGLAIDEELNKQFSVLLNNDFNSFQEIYSKSNKELSYIAFGIPYQDNGYWRYSLCKINIPKSDAVTTYNEFKLMITGDSLSGLLVYDSDGKSIRMVANETDSVNVTKTFVCNSEDEVIDTFFNRSSNGKISSVKVSGYNYSIAVVKGDVSNTYYIFKLDAILSERGIESVPYYNGNFTIYNKIINQESKEYEQGIGDNFITIESNELMTNNVNVSDDKDYSIMEYVSQNILNDYSSGVNSVNLTISCSDMFDTNGNLVIDFAKGQILQIGDIVRIDKDNNGTSLWFYDNGTPMYWRVTGRNFRKVGVPMIDLELQEVRLVN